MSMEASANNLRLEVLQSAIANVCLARRHLEEDQVRAVGRASKAAEASFAERANEVRSQAEDLLNRGVPPSLRHLCGTRDLEVPMNRTLGWLLDPGETHGAGNAPLLHLARGLDLATMASDLRDQAPVSVCVESSPDPARWWREPDFVVETPNAVLLLENKVLAPESDPGQYADYLSMVEELSDGRRWHAFLLARDNRECPPGWTGSLRHAELADILAPLCEARSLSAWTRIVGALVATDLRDADLTTRIGPIRELLDRVPDGPLQPMEVRRLTRLLEDLPDFDPWEPP